ncbi:MAG: hypothetical protein ACOCRX_10310 [Candidatus Woesearchaeota archaeon]
MRNTANMGTGGYNKSEKKVMEMMRRDIEGIDIEDVDIVGLVNEFEVVRESYEKAKKNFNTLRNNKKKGADKKFEEDIKNAKDSGYIQKAQKERLKAYIAIDTIDSEVREARDKYKKIRNHKELLENTINAFNEEHSDIIEEVKREKLKQDIIKVASALE